MQQIATYSTRFQGSKRRIVSWVTKEIVEAFPDSQTVLDAFTGTGTIAYALAMQGKQVTVCDQLASSLVNAQAFIGNNATIDIEKTLGNIEQQKATQFLSPFQGALFLDAELRWLERASAYANSLPLDERAAVFWAVFQSAMAKRPYNLFHRANLSMRQKEVKRSFGNKATWDRSFADHMRKFLLEREQYKIDALPPKMVQGDTLLAPTGFDVVYLDPPYITGKGTTTPYFDFYGFLDILLDPSLITTLNYEKAHKPLLNPNPSPWEDKTRIHEAFEMLIEKHKDSGIVVSYRDDGMPSSEELLAMVSKYKQTEIHKMPIKYALSKTNAHEILIIGK